MNDNIDKILNMENLDDLDLEQVSGGLNSKNKGVVMKKVQKLFNEGKIDAAMRKRILVAAFKENEETYKIIVSNIARAHHISLDDIMF